jgi:hypothetical protein
VREPNHCKACGAPIPETAKRVSTRRRRQAFAGRGREREYCDAKCRKRAQRLRDLPRKRDGSIDELALRTIKRRR